MRLGRHFDALRERRRIKKSIKDLERIKRMYAVNYSKILLPSKTACIVDLGCGNGEALEWLTDLGYRNLYGVDADPVKLRVVRQRLEGLVPPENIVNGDILEFVRACADNSVDIFFMNNIIEHLAKTYILELIPEIIRSLKPGGILVAKTGNMENPFNLGLFARDFTHEVFFAGHSLRRLLTMCGFEANMVEVNPVKPGVTLLNWPLLILSHIMGWILKGVARLMLIQIRETAALIYCVARKSL